MKKKCVPSCFSGDFTYSVKGGLSFILEESAHLKKVGSCV